MAGAENVAGSTTMTTPSLVSASSARCTVLLCEPVAALNAPREIRASFRCQP